MNKFFVIGSLGMVLGFAGSSILTTPPRGRALPDGPTVVSRLRQMADLTTLNALVYKKVSFSPDPVPQPTPWSAVWQWLEHSVRKPEGRAIVFGRVRVGIDLATLDDHRLAVGGEELWVVMPPMHVAVEVLPGETEIIGSNLDSQQTAQLLEKAKLAFELDARKDQQLFEKAELSARSAIEALALQFGFSAVHFVDALPNGLRLGGQG